MPVLDTSSEYSLVCAVELGCLLSSYNGWFTEYTTLSGVIVTRYWDI